MRLIDFLMLRSVAGEWGGGGMVSECGTACRAQSRFVVVVQPFGS